jgi:starch phosphorylase
MLIDYSNKFYFPALKNYRRLVRDDYAEGKSLAAYMSRLQQAWDGLNIVKIESNAKPVMQRGDSLTVTASIDLGPLQPSEALVELYHGTVSNQGNDIANALRVEMKDISHEGSVYQYQVRIECTETGQQGHTVRILPKHDALVHPYRTGLIKWG